MARASTLTKFASQAPIVVDTPVAANWTSSGSTGTPTVANATIPAIIAAPPVIGAPTTGLQLTNGTAASQTNVIRTFGVAQDLSAATYIDVLVYWPNAPVGNNLVLYVDSTGSNFTNYVLATMNGALTGTQKRGWNCYRILKTAFSPGAGTMNWANVTRLQLRLTTVSGADTVIVAQINASYRSRAKVLLTFDDGAISQFAAVQEANNAGIKMSLNVVPSLVISGGGTTYMSVANLQALVAAGNVIQTHGWDHTTFINQSDGGYADIIQQRNWLAANGMGPSVNSGFYHHAWVQGEHNAAVDAAMCKAGVLTARGVRGTSYSAGPPERYEQTASWDQQNGSFGLVDPYTLNCVALDNTTVTAAAALVMIDKAINHGVSIWFYAHVLSNSATDFSTANWTTLVNGIKARIQQGSIDAITQPQYYHQIVNGRALVS